MVNSIALARKARASRNAGDRRVSFREPVVHDDDSTETPWDASSDSSDSSKSLTVFPKSRSKGAINDFRSSCYYFPSCVILLGALAGAIFVNTLGYDEDVKEEEGERQEKTVIGALVGGVSAGLVFYASLSRK